MVAFHDSMTRLAILACEENRKLILHIKKNMLQ